MIRIKKTENGDSRYHVSVKIDFDFESILSIVDKLIVPIITAVIAGLIVALITHFMFG